MQDRLKSQEHPLTGQPVIRQFSPRDVGAVVHLHIEVFDRFSQRFLLSLGDKGLTDVFLGLSSLEPQGFLVAELDGNIVGFIVGLGESRRLIEIIPRIVAKAMLGTYEMRFSRLNFLRMGVGHLLSVRRSSEAELLEIVVDDKHRLKGIGRRLMESFLGYLQDRGAKRVRVLVDNRYEVSKIFYEDNFGFKVIRKIRTPSGEMVLLERGLS